MPAPAAPAAPAVTAARGLAARLLAAATAGYAGVLLYATHHPRPQELLGGPMPADKLLHFLAYGLLALLVAVTLAATRAWSRRAVLTAALLLAAFAAADEATQRWFGRDTDLWDWLFDCLGIAAGIAAGGLVRLLVRARRGAGGRQ